MSNQENADAFTPKQLIIFLIILFLLASSALGIIVFNDAQIAKAQQLPTKITNVAEIPEQFEKFQIKSVSYDETDTDFQQPTGVPATHVTVTSTINYTDGQSDDIESHFDVDFNDNADHTLIAHQKYDRLIGKSFTRRNSAIHHYDITAVNLKTKEVYHLTSLEQHHVGEKQTVAQLNNFASSFDSATGNGSYDSQTRKEIIEQQPDN